MPAATVHDEAAVADSSHTADASADAAAFAATFSSTESGLRTLFRSVSAVAGARLRLLSAAVTLKSRAAGAASARAAHRRPAKHEPKHARRVPCRPRRVYLKLVCLLGLVLALSATQEYMAWLLRTGACEGVADESPCGTRTVLELVVLGKQLICALVGLALTFSRTACIVRHRRRLQQALERGVQSSISVRADQWTAVASQDTFEEMAKMVSMAQLIVYISLGSSICVATAAQVRSSLYRWQMSTSESWVLRACCSECEPLDVDCACDRLCKVSCVSMEAFLTFNVGVLVCLIAPVIFIPRSIWSPVADAAFTSRLLPNEPHFKVLRRTRRLLPLPVPTLATLTAGSVAVYAGNIMAPSAFQSVQLWWLVLGANVCMSAALVCLFFWSVGVRRLLTLPLSLAYTCLSAVIGAIGACGKGTDQGPRRPRGLDRAKGLFRCRGSWRYRQSVLLIACLYCFCVEALYMQAHSMYELYIGRVATLLLLLATRDAETEPGALSSDGAGFGLLVSARHMSAALRAHLAGQRYSGRMPRYKATGLRMQETLAISYRWHDECCVPLGAGGAELNITRWQAVSLLAGIRASGCQYVWMDKLAIPPGVDAATRTTLLSRMMAVYSSALATLALRSAEAQGHRYHQRAWTLQEYCAAQTLMVMTEEVGGGGEGGAVAVLEVEEEVVEALRREHMARQAACEPVWLKQGGATAIMRSTSRADAARISGTYDALSSALHCRYRADMVRALYPLLWNRPAESEQELVALLRAVEEVHGLPQAALVGLLKESCTRPGAQEDSLGTIPAITACSATGLAGERGDEPPRIIQAAAPAPPRRLPPIAGTAWSSAQPS